MLPISIIGFKNFRIFNDHDGFFEDLSAINLLTGTNNSGKSSIIKGMQLLKNSVNSDAFPHELDLTDQEHLLGSLENMLFNKDNKEIMISLPFNFFGMRNGFINLTYAVFPNDSYRGKLRKIEIIEGIQGDLLFFFEYKEATENDIADDKEEFERQVREYDEMVEDPDISKRDLTKTFGFFGRPFRDPMVGLVEWQIDCKKLGSYLTDLLKFYTLYLNEDRSSKWLDWVDRQLETENVNFIPSIVVRTFRSKPDLEKWKDFLEKLKGVGTLNGIQKISESDFEPPEVYYPQREVEDVFYLSTLEIMRNKLTWKDVEESEDSRFKYNVLEEAVKKSWEFLKHRILSINYLSTVREQHVRIYNAALNSPFINLLRGYIPLQTDHNYFVNKYLNAFEIGKNLKVELRVDYQLISVSVIDLNGEKRELVDYGYGIKQLILLLIQITVLSERNKRMVHDYGEEGEESFGDEFDPSLLLIEEPETNLHPKWQSLLAEMFYEANKKFNIQFVIETHSEYLIRNFQNLVASAALSAGNIKLFYLRNIKAASSGNIQVENVVVESDGGINYELFDNGFFDESTNLQLSLLNIRRDRFITEFVELKRNLEENEEKLTFLEAKIDEFSSRTNFIKYVDEVNFLFEISKLDPKTVDYLASGLYLLYNIGSGSDFSPVILQYGRAMENELNKLFRSVDAGKSWKIGVMQGSLEKFKSGANTIPAVCNNSEFSILLSLLPNIFEDPFELEIELIDDLRKKRNEVAHPGLIMTKTDAEEYVEDMKQFLTSWTENMR